MQEFLSPSSSWQCHNQASMVPTLPRSQHCGTSAKGNPRGEVALPETVDPELCQRQLFVPSSRDNCLCLRHCCCSQIWHLGLLQAPCPCPRRATKGPQVFGDLPPASQRAATIIPLPGQVLHTNTPSGSAAAARHPLSDCLCWRSDTAHHHHTSSGLIPPRPFEMSSQGAGCQG